MSFTAVILAGGKSSRMGRDKAFLEVGGQTLLARQIEIVKAAGAKEILISGQANRDYSAYALPVVLDQFTNTGPLAGIHAALRVASEPLLLVAAVDLPNLHEDMVRRLVIACSDGLGAIPRIDDDIEPLIAIYPRRAAILAESFLQAEYYTVKTFAQQCVQRQLARWLDFGAAEQNCFVNWNSPVDTRSMRLRQPMSEE